MTPDVILRELSQIQIGDIQLQTTTGQDLVLRRVARPNAEQESASWMPWACNCPSASVTTVFCSEDSAGRFAKKTLGSGRLVHYLYTKNCAT